MATQTWRFKKYSKEHRSGTVILAHYRHGRDRGESDFGQEVILFLLKALHLLNLTGRFFFFFNAAEASAIN